MQIGMVGLGRMGGNMALRLLRAGHEVVGYDLDEDVVRGLTDHGLEGAASLEALAEKLHKPRHIWMMVPSGPAVDATIDALSPSLDDGDVLIDGGNSDYRDTLDRHDRLLAMGIHLVDVGTSGGVWGLENGYCLMAGGVRNRSLGSRARSATWPPMVMQVGGAWVRPDRGISPR